MSSEAEEEEDGYVVEKILKKKKMSNGQIKYLVKWQGYEEEKDQTWEPKENLDNVKEMVDNFEKAETKKTEKPKPAPEKSETKKKSKKKPEEEAKKEESANDSESD